ncbi:hypothetical protein ACHAAC_07905 [Aeromicrobium sp. CF4.19]|uniref:hypothetical protein n=1 Tax=Aeromicrobium sp. CF4.19 TaxID=3373082 RepID=UPI003EE6AF31
MNRYALGGLVVAMVLVLVACGGDEGGAEPSPSPSATDSLDEEGLAGVISDDPEDVTWGVGEVPGSWRQLETGDGEAQWQVTERCLLTLFQPAGLGSDPSPTQDEVLDDYATRLGESVSGGLQVAERGTEMFPVRSNVEGTMSSKVARAELRGGDGVAGEIIAHRSGDFALVTMTLCADGSFDEVDASDFQPFIDDLVIEATY